MRVSKAAPGVETLRRALALLVATHAKDTGVVMGPLTDHIITRLTGANEYCIGYSSGHADITLSRVVEDACHEAFNSVATLTPGGWDVLVCT